MELQCELCPKNCVIASGQSGECRIRVNLDDKLVAVTYCYPVSVHVDPGRVSPPSTPAQGKGTKSALEGAMYSGGNRHAGIYIDISSNNTFRNNIFYNNEFDQLRFAGNDTSDYGTRREELAVVQFQVRGRTIEYSSAGDTTILCQIDYSGLARS